MKFGEFAPARMCKKTSVEPFLQVATLGNSRVCAVWNELAKVQLWNLNGALKEVSGMEGASRSVKLRERPLFSFVGHRAEGYALAWSPIRLGIVSPLQLLLCRQCLNLFPSPFRKFRSRRDARLV